MQRSIGPSAGHAAARWLPCPARTRGPSDIVGGRRVPPVLQSSARPDGFHGPAAGRGRVSHAGIFRATAREGTMSGDTAAAVIACRDIPCSRLAGTMTGYTAAAPLAQGAHAADIGLH